MHVPNGRVSIITIVETTMPVKNARRRFALASCRIFIWSLVSESLNGVPRSRVSAIYSAHAIIYIAPEYARTAFNLQRIVVY